MNANEIEFLLSKSGLKKISEKKHSASGITHTFDNAFIEAFTKYLTGGPGTDMTKSQFNNIKLFIDFADEKILKTHKDYDSLVECNKYLATIGVE